MNAQAAQHTPTFKHKKWAMYWARTGYAARGVVYVLVGIIAIGAAFGGGQTEGTRGAIQSLLDKPLGQLLVGLIALGLVGYALWRFLQGVMDADGHGQDGKAIVVRAGLIMSAVTHVFLAFYAGSLLFGWSSGGGGDNTKSWTAQLMSQPFGRWLVALVGLAVIGAGVAQIVKAYKERFKRYLALPPQFMSWASTISKAGLTARAIVFLIIGAFFMIAAWNANPEEAKGLEGALQTLREQPYGPWLLALVGLGLLAFAVYSFLEARYRRVYI